MLRWRAWVAVAVLPFFTLAACASVTSTSSVRADALPLGALTALECRDSGAAEGDAPEPLELTTIGGLEIELRGCPQSVAVHGVRFESPRRIVRDEVSLTFAKKEGEAPIVIQVEPGDSVEFVLSDGARTAGSATAYTFVIVAFFVLCIAWLGLSG